ncbi:MAG TPA: DNA mismatch repair protein MutS, partial [Solibacterales bacterium]|nr:DNA mismatch repair protein MutS [Bryobacterales bacterium]
EATLARWLTRAADGLEIRSRQEAVTELRPKLDLREDLALLGEAVRAGVHAAELVAWSRRPALRVTWRARLLAPLLVLLFVAALVGWGLAKWPVSVVLAAVVPLAAFRLAHRRTAAAIVAAVDRPGGDLELLGSVLSRLEREPFLNLRLRELRGRMDVEGKPASRRIRRLNRLVELLDSRDHVLMKALDPLLLWTEQLSFAIEAWRRTHGPGVEGWLDALGELEALSSIAAYAFEHPHDPFPEILDGGADIDATGIAHPLLPETAVRNDVRLSAGEGCAVFFVSGSNMSGKSTLLR